MKLHAITTCLDYAPELEHGLRRWRDGLDSWVVATARRDVDTLALCRRNGVEVYVTDAWTQDGAAFNKAAVLGELLPHVDPEAYVLLLDADVSPPPDWRAIVEAHVQPGAIHGACRALPDGTPFIDDEIGGFFQLFHASDPVWTADPTLGSWRNASGYDSMLQGRWPRSRRVRLPLVLTHHGEPGRNWLGKANPITDQRAWWRDRGDWRAERLDR